MCASVRKIIDIMLSHISFFTIIPAPSRLPVQEALRYVDFSILTVSIPIAVIIALVGELLNITNMSPRLACVLLYLLNIVLTGYLHMDGVTDVLDAMFAPPEKRHTILKDPHIGAIGACGLFTLLSLGVATALSTSSVQTFLRMLVLSEMFSRLSCSICARAGEPLHEGLGSIVVKAAKERPYLIAVPLTVTGLTAVLLLGLARGIVFTLASILLTVPLILIAVRKLGGVSGDVLGYSIEIGRHIALLALACLA